MAKCQQYLSLAQKAKEAKDGNNCYKYFKSFFFLNNCFIRYKYLFNFSDAVNKSSKLLVENGKLCDKVDTCFGVFTLHNLVALQ